MGRSRTWNLRLNLDEFNSACWSLTTDQERALFLTGLLAGMNNGNLVVNLELTSRVTGFGIGQRMRSEAEAYRTVRAEIGKLGGRPAKPQGLLDVNLKGNLGVTQSTILNPLTTNSTPLPPKGGNHPPLEKKKKKIRTTGLKPESVESWEAVLDEFPKTFSRWDDVTKSYTQDPISKGSLFQGQLNFQAIVDAGAATPYELYASFHAYVTEEPKVSKGFVQQLSTFFGPGKATWLEWLGRGRELIARDL